MPTSPILTPPAEGHRVELRSLRPFVGTLLLGVGIALITGALIDYGILWLLQFESNSQWEFAALTTSLDNFALILVGLAAWGGGLHLKDSHALWAQRFLGLLCILFGVLMFAALFFLVTDYFELHTSIEDLARPAFHASMAKATIQAAVYGMSLVVAGVRGIR